MMFDTPEKGNLHNSVSLKERIQRKLQTDKKVLETRENILKQFQSHNKKSSNQNPCHAPVYQGVNRLGFNVQKGQGNFQSFSSHKQPFYEPLISQANVLEYESLQNRNFYGFEEWLEFNKKFFSHVQEQTVKNLWKIMRIINYGDVWIPSGLIFQISKILTQNEKSEKNQLKQSFNDFLRFNHASDQISNFRELKNYPTFEEIENEYLKLSGKNKNQSFKKSKQYSSMRKLSENDIDFFQKAHNESKLKNSRRNKMIYRSLIKKNIDQECLFKPLIKKYCPEKFFADESNKAPRPCKMQQKWMVEALEVQNFVQNSTFKAQPYQKSKFQNTTLESIPGVSEYIERKRESQSKKRKLDRYNQRPNSVYRHFN